MDDWHARQTDRIPDCSCGGPPAKRSIARSSAGQEVLILTTGITNEPSSRLESLRPSPQFEHGSLQSQLLVGRGQPVEKNPVRHSLIRRRQLPVLEGAPLRPSLAYSLSSHPLTDQSRRRARSPLMMLLDGSFLKVISHPKQLYSWLQMNKQVQGKLLPWVLWRGWESRSPFPRTHKTPFNFRVPSFRFHSRPFLPLLHFFPKAIADTSSIHRQI